MARRLSGIIRLFAVSLCLLLSQNVSAQERAASPASDTPTAVAKESFAALKRQDIGAFVALFHPAETQKFQAFARELFRYEKPDATVLKMRSLFAPLNTAEQIAEATGSDLLETFIKSALKGLPAFATDLSKVNLEVLGEIAESPEKAHVIAKALLPRPQAISCQKWQKQWRLRLNEEALQMITLFERKKHFDKRPLGAGSVGGKTAMGRIEVLGSVREDANTAQLLCRIQMKIEDFEFPLLGVYPVRSGEPAWKWLKAKNPDKLIAALRAKWAR